MRKINARILAPVMKLTGFKFTKAYRHGDTLFHSIVYSIVDTVEANHLVIK